MKYYKTYQNYISIPNTKNISNGNNRDLKKKYYKTNHVSTRPFAPT